LSYVHFWHGQLFKLLINWYEFSSQLGSDTWVINLTIQNMAMIEKIENLDDLSEKNKYM
jgi:hypothetical protein